MRIFNLFTLIFLLLTTNLKSMDSLPEELIKAITTFNIYADLYGESTLKILPPEETENVFCDISPVWPNGKKKNIDQFKEEIRFHKERLNFKRFPSEVLRAPNNVWIHCGKADPRLSCGEINPRRLSFNHDNILCIDGFPLRQNFTDPWYNLASFPGKEISLMLLVNNTIKIVYHDWGNGKERFQFINIKKKCIYQTLNEAD